jgi:catechol 2,3-dioxygenase-like lactoylglutathione lyase family enzyme
VRLTHVRLLVDDFAACFRFYRDAMGFAPTFGSEGEGGYADFRAGDCALAILERTGMKGVADLRPAGDGAMLVVSVGDVDAEAERLRGAGVELESEPHDQRNWGLRVVHVRDPASNLLELYRPLGEPLSR